MPPLPPEHIPSSAVAARLTLRHPTRPASRLRKRLQRQMPDLDHEGGWLRFTGQDTATMSPRERGHERRRLLAAAATTELDEVPAWLWMRLRKLEGQR